MRTGGAGRAALLRDEAGANAQRASSAHTRGKGAKAAAGGARRRQQRREQLARQHKQLSRREEQRQQQQLGAAVGNSLRARRAQQQEEEARLLAKLNKVRQNMEGLMGPGDHGSLALPKI